MSTTSRKFQSRSRSVKCKKPTTPSSAEKDRENKRISTEADKIEHENQQLTPRICNLENKLLESSVVFEGVQESPWETETVQQEKIYLAIS